MKYNSRKRRKVTHEPSSPEVFPLFSINSFLHQLAKASKTQEIHCLLKEQKADTHAYDEQGYTALHYAVYARQTIDVAEVLLKNGADPNIKTLQDGKTLLHLAACYNKPELTKLLIDYKATQYIKDKEGKTPLYIACEKNYFKVVSALLSFPIDASNCLHQLAQKSKVTEIQRLLKEQKADLHEYDHKGYTALHYAVYARQTIAVLDALLKHGANPNTQTRLEKSSPLHLAARNNRKKSVTRLLLEHNINYDLKDYLGQTPLYLASEANLFEIASILLEHGAQPNYQSNNGSSPLYCAILHHNPVMLNMLLKHKADINAKDNFPIIGTIGVWSKSILHWAIHHRNLKIISLVLKYQPNIHARDHLGQTPLHEAVQTGSLEIVALILKHPNIDIHAINKYGANALHYAAFSSKTPEIIKLLFQKGLHIESRTPEGLTPLHIAIKSENKIGIAALLAQGARIYTLDNKGRSIFTYALIKGSSEIMHMLFCENLSTWTYHNSHKTGLYISTRCNDSNHHTSLAKLLCKCVDQLTNDKYGWHALHHVAASPQYFSVLKTIAAQKNINLEVRTQKEATPLHIATSYCNLSAVTVLLKHKADTRARDYQGWTPFQVAVSRNAPQLISLLHDANLLAHLESFTQKMIQKTADRNLIDYAKSVMQLSKAYKLSDIRESLTQKTVNLLEKDSSRQTIATYAKRALQCLQKANEELLEHANNGGDTALLIAAQRGTLNTLQWLLAQGAYPNATNHLGNTAIHYAAQFNLPPIISLLQLKGVDIYERNSHGHSPLQIAAYCANYHPTLMWLLEKTTDRNTQEDRRTIACSAARTGTICIMQTLDDKKIDMQDSRDSRGNTTLHIASKAGNLATTEWLIAKFPKLCSLQNNNQVIPLEKAIKAYQETPSEGRTKTEYHHREQIIALLFIQKKEEEKTEGHVAPPMDEDLHLYSISAKQQKDTICRTIQYMRAIKREKEIIRNGLDRINYLPKKWTSFYSEKTAIEAAIRLSPTEQKSLLFIIKYFPKCLPSEIRMMIAHELWKGIQADPSNRARMQAYPSIIHHTLKPSDLYHSLAVIEARRSFGR